jgi:DNA-binding beta-propeller fold protein YncE
VGNFPIGIIFDGTSIWVANSGSNTVSKITRTLP